MPTKEENEKMEKQAALPRGQALFDNVALWFILSLVLSLVLYNGWGLIELIMVPTAP